MTTSRSARPAQRRAQAVERYRAHAAATIDEYEWLRSFHISPENACRRLGFNPRSIVRHYLLLDRVVPQDLRTLDNQQRYRRAS